MMTAMDEFRLRPWGRWLDWLDSPEGVLHRKVTGHEGTDTDLACTIPTPPGQTIITVGDLRLMVAWLRAERASPPRREDQASISRWIEETFGPAGTNARVVARANEEMAEMLRSVTSDDNHPELAEEIADVFIVLYRVASRLGVDVHAEIDRKMAVNRARKWALDGTGCGYHIDPTVERDDIDRMYNQTKEAVLAAMQAVGAYDPAEPGSVTWDAAGLERIFRSVMSKKEERHEQPDFGS
jgi:hypothetical protein